MQPTSMAASATNLYYPIPNRILVSHHHSHHNPRSTIATAINPKPLCLSSPLTAHRCSNKHQQNPFDNSLLFHHFHPKTDTADTKSENPEPEYQENQGFARAEAERKDSRAEMRWSEVKAAAGQRLNVEGVVSSISVLLREGHLAIPHVAVPDVRYIDWGVLKRKGFKGVVFDKDNTLTAPYSLSLWPPLGASIDRCKDVFGNDIAVFSNSAGLEEYDHDGRKARALEGAIGIKVLRHRVKKPAGTAEEIEKHFGCASSQLIMVGDRPFTDIVYGNRNGFLTVLTEPLSLAEEPFIIRQVRKLELGLLNHWWRRGLKPVSHSLLPDVTQCVKDPSML